VNYPSPGKVGGGGGSGISSPSANMGVLMERTNNRAKARAKIFLKHFIKPPFTLFICNYHAIKELMNVSHVI